MANKLRGVMLGEKHGNHRFVSWSPVCDQNISGINTVFSGSNDMTVFGERHQHVFPSSMNYLNSYLSHTYVCLMEMELFIPRFNSLETLHVVLKQLKVETV